MLASGAEVKITFMLFFKTNKQARKMMASCDKPDSPTRVKCWGRVWIGGMVFSLPISGLNPCCEAGKKLGKGKASMCFILFRPPVSFSGCLKHWHGRTTSAWAIWGWDGPRGLHVRAGRGFVQPSPDSLPWCRAGWSRCCESQRDGSNPKTSETIVYHPLPPLDTALLQAWHYNFSDIKVHPWRGTAAPNQGGNRKIMAKPEPLSLPCSPFSPSAFAQQVPGWVFCKCLFSKNDLIIHSFHF